MNALASSFQVHQEHLGIIIKQIFPNDEITFNQRAGLALENPATGRRVELDIFIPELHLCFEFQDPYHYMTVWYSHRSATSMRELDGSKWNQTRTEEMTLIPVACWWDGTQESLATSIQFYRPDILQHRDFESSPITLNPPFGFMDMGVPEVGELMAASFAADAKFSADQLHENAWWLGEKYDGVRCCWSNSKARLYARSGRVIDILPSFKRKFPAVFLDGEIWFGRSNFSLAHKMIRGSLDLFVWTFLRVIAFDSPHIKMQKTPFEKRYKHFFDRLRKNHPFIIPAYRLLCVSKKQLTLTVHEILNDGGEGVILRYPKSIFEQGRSNLLVKIKASRGDKEGVVVSVSKKHLCLKLPDGKLLNVPHDYVETPVPPKSGDIVTFMYNSISTRAKPVHPTVVRIREDLTWAEVVANFVREKPQAQMLNDESADAVSQPKHFGYWTLEKQQNLRKFFEDFAKSYNMDPLLSDTWYTVPLRDLKEVKGGTGVMNACKGGVVPTIVRLFPELGLEVSKFAFKTMIHWDDVKKRRKYFDAVAKEHGFDPLEAKNWYSLPLTKEVIAQGAAVLRHHSMSFIKALTHLFPEIEWDEHKFNLQTFYQDTDNRRYFFTQFAKEKRFDPLIVSNWYEIPLSNISKRKGASEILHHYLSMSNAFMILFPELSATKSKLFNPQYNNWTEKEARRKWFEDLATSLNKDPLVPHHWYHMSSKDIYARPGAAGVLRYYKGGVYNALSELFPDVEFDYTKFQRTPYKTMKETETRRRIILNFAKEHGFNPLDHAQWYKRFHELRKYKGMHSISYHHGGVMKALIELLPEVKFQIHKFPLAPKLHWKSPENRRMFLESIAKEKGLNPLNSRAWSTININALQTRKEMRSLLKYHHGSFTQALKDLFPDVPLADDFYQSENFLASMENKRDVFTKYAASRGFDPLIPENWYNVDRTRFLAFKGAPVVLSIYGGSLIAACMDVFPNIGLDKGAYRHFVSLRGGFIRGQKAATRKRLQVE